MSFELFSEWMYRFIIFLCMLGIFIGLYKVMKFANEVCEVLPE